MQTFLHTALMRSRTRAVLLPKSANLDSPPSERQAPRKGLQCAALHIYAASHAVLCSSCAAVVVRWA